MQSQIELVTFRNILTEKKGFPKYKFDNMYHYFEKKNYVHNETNSFRINTNNSIKSEFNLNIHCLQRYSKYQYCHF